MCLPIDEVYIKRGDLYINIIEKLYSGLNQAYVSPSNATCFVDNDKNGQRCPTWLRVSSMGILWVSPHVIWDVL